MLQRTAIKRKSKTKREKRRESSVQEYWEWLATQDCIITETPKEYGVDRSHLARSEYGHGMGIKALDWFAIPLKHELHVELERDKEAWEKRYGWQETWLLRVWANYGIEKVPQSVQSMFVTPEGEDAPPHSFHSLRTDWCV